MSVENMIEKYSDGKHKRIILPILVPIALVILILLGTSIFTIYQLQEWHIQEETRKDIDKVSYLFRQELKKEAETLNGLIDFLEKDKSLQEAWLAQDRQMLLEYALPIFEEIRPAYRVTHFYFMDPDRTCFLRVHNPPRRGDTIKRFTLAGAMREQKPYWGIELGPLGTFTLRVVQPWQIDGKLSGYLELGMEIEHLTPQLKEILGKELLFVIEKSHLHRPDWEAGMKMLGRTGMWEQFPEHVLISSTQEDFSPLLGDELEGHRKKYEKFLFEITKNDRKYLGGFVPLFDAGEREVGEIIVLNDVTQDEAQLRESTVLLIGISCIIGLILLVFFYFYVTRIEQKLSRAYQGQEKEINERQRTEEALRDAMQQAESANRSKSEFLANMSHEIRTPMNAILGFSDLLAQEELNEEQVDNIKTIQNSGEHLLRLIDDILDFSKIEAGKLEIEMVQCSLEDVLTGIASLLHPVARRKGLDFKILHRTQLPSQIYTDPGRVRQCLTNLVGNAVKFTETGHVHISVSLETNNGKDGIRFEIEDTGIGIPAQKLETIFEMFSQADSSTTRKFGGTGLGLTITKRLAEMLGGNIKVQSEPAKGTIFSLWIPTGMDGKSQNLLGRQSLEGYVNDPNDLPNERFKGRVLVAEDRPANQESIRIMLQKKGLEVTIVEDGKKAVEAARKQSFHLILLDMQMPNLNGYLATKILRKKGLTTPIIALTACALKGDAEKCLDAGCDDYLSKPVSRAKLLEILSKYLPSDSVVPNVEQYS